MSALHCQFTDTHMLLQPNKQYVTVTKVHSHLFDTSRLTYSTVVIHPSAICDCECNLALRGARCCPIRPKNWEADLAVAKVNAHRTETGLVDLITDSLCHPYCSCTKTVEQTRSSDTKLEAEPWKGSLSEAGNIKTPPDAL